MTEYANNDGVRIAYERHDGAGPDAPWILLVHGLGYARWGWEPVVDRLAERFRVLLFDNRGIGDSDVPDGPYTAAGMAGDALAVLDAAGVDRAHVAGTSLGGMVAQELARAHPERVDRLVLVCTVPGGDATVPMPQQTVDLLARMPQLEPEVALRLAIENAFSDETVAARPELVERILAHRTAAPQDPAGWQAQASAGTTYTGGDLGDLTMPTLVVHGTQDVVLDPDNARVLADGLPDAELVFFEGAGHLLFWEQPDRFVEVVTDFLT